MEKKILAVLFISACIFSNAQTSIPNGNFESWYSSPFEYPQDYSFTTIREAFFKCNASLNVIKTTDAFNGNFAVLVNTVTGSSGDTCAGAFTNAINMKNNFPNWQGGIPYNEQPIGIKGYYKSSVQSGDTARLGLIFKQGGTVFASYVFPLYGTHMSYTPFTFIFNSALASIPDSVIIFATSSDFMNKISIPGSMIKLDSLSFTGVINQPSMNADFEKWIADTIRIADKWNIGNMQGMGFTRTSDAAVGSFAAELTTYLDDNGTPKARGGEIVNGNWNTSCTCWKGGYPFSNQMDTLLFFYKYTPMASDSASVSLTFRKNGSTIHTAGINLGASANYQLMQLAFDAGQTPDSVVMQFKSSLWQNTALSFVGSDLKVDGVHFVSQPLSSVPESAVNNSIGIYPNPSSGKFRIQNSGLRIQKIEVYNIVGECIYKSSITTLYSLIDLSVLPNGIYFVEMVTSENSITQKITINK